MTVCFDKWGRDFWRSVLFLWGSCSLCCALSVLFLEDFFFLCCFICSVFGVKFGLCFPLCGKFNCPFFLFPMRQRTGKTSICHVERSETSLNASMNAQSCFTSFSMTIPERVLCKLILFDCNFCFLAFYRQAQMQCKKEFVMLSTAKHLWTLPRIRRDALLRSAWQWGRRLLANQFCLAIISVFSLSVFLFCFLFSLFSIPCFFFFYFFSDSLNILFVCFSSSARTFSHLSPWKILFPFLFPKCIILYNNVYKNHIPIRE